MSGARKTVAHLALCQPLPCKAHLMIEEGTRHFWLIAIAFRFLKTRCPSPQPVIQSNRTGFDCDME